MSYKEIHVIILVGLVISSALYAARIIRDRTMTLADLPRRTVVVPTATPTRTPTPGPTATPEGWTLVRDPVTGEQYLSPPPDVEAQVREAFEAVLGCTAIQDTSDEVALQYSREAALERAARLATPKIVEHYRQVIRVMLVTLGPENPVRCSGYAVCSLARAQLGSNGAIIYDGNMCSDIGINSDVCLVRPSQFDITDNDPHLLYIATIEHQEDSVWRVVDFRVEKLPEPLAPPEL
jgi:hypothetical protein